MNGVGLLDHQRNTPPSDNAVDPAQWLRRSNQIIGSAALVLAIGAFGFVIAMFGVSQQYEAIRVALIEMRHARVANFLLLEASIDAESGQRGYMLTNDPHFLTSYERGRAGALTALERLHASTSHVSSLRADVDRTDALTRAALNKLQIAVGLQEHGSPRRQLMAQFAESRAAMDDLRAAAARLRDALESVSEDNRATERSRRITLYWIGGLLGALTLLAAGLTMWALQLERRSWRNALEALERANVAAEEARARATASDLAKTRFLAVASHDMRQPLHALTLYLSALDRRVENTEAREIVAKMERATHSMVSMFSTLLDLARIQVDVITPEVETFPLQDVLDRIVAEHADGRVKASTTTLQARTDSVLLERLLRNLVGNAVKHGGGAARIEVRTIGDAAEIAVIDNGPGIAPEDQQRIFDEFVRVDKSANASGLGLGLAIVKRIADVLDLPLELRSAPGQGARFAVQVPLADPAPPSAKAEVNEEASLAGADVLVLDDDALAREAVAGALRDLGANVRICADEADASALLDSGMRPSLLVMDFRIDGELLGIDIANRLRERFQPAPQVVMITGDTGSDTLERLRASGHAWLIKPVTPRDLREVAMRRLQEA